MFVNFLKIITYSGKTMQNRWLNCGVRGIGQVARLSAARAEVRLTRAFGSGTVRQGRCRRQSWEGGLEVIVREQQGKAP